MNLKRILNWRRMAANELEEFVPEVDSLEADISMAMLKIASERPMGIAEFSLLKKELPAYVNLPGVEVSKPSDNPGDEYWEEQFRKIAANFGKRGNLLSEGHIKKVPDVGFRITSKGRRYLRSKGFVPSMEW